MVSLKSITNTINVFKVIFLKVKDKVRALTVTKMGIFSKVNGKMTKNTQDNTTTHQEVLSKVNFQKEKCHTAL